MSQPSFTSLIVTYNSASEISNLLDDLLLHSPGNQIIVIDNASRDKTVQVVQERYPRTPSRFETRRMWDTPEPLIRGFNIAIRNTYSLFKPRYSHSLSPGFHGIGEVPETVTPRIAAVAPLQFKDDNGRRSLNFTWSYMTTATLKLYLSFSRQRKLASIDPMRVTFLNAGCLLIRRTTFEQVGRLNQKYFLYGEEPDLFLKFRRYGFECYLLPAVAVIHYRERSLMTGRRVAAPADSTLLGMECCGCTSSAGGRIFFGTGLGSKHLRRENGKPPIRNGRPILQASGSF